MNKIKGIENQPLINESKEHLIEIIDRLTAELAQAKGEIERSEKERDRFKRELMIAAKIKKPSDYDWNVLGRIDDLEQENAALKRDAQKYKQRIAELETGTRLLKANALISTER